MAADDAPIAQRNRAWDEGRRLREEVRRLEDRQLTPEEAEYALRYLPTEPVEHSTCQAKLRAIAESGPKDPCTECDGKGHYSAWPHVTCPTCKGTGRMAE